MRYFVLRGRGINESVPALALTNIIGRQVRSGNTKFSQHGIGVSSARGGCRLDEVGTAPLITGTVDGALLDVGPGGVGGIEKIEWLCLSVYVCFAELTKIDCII